MNRATVVLALLVGGGIVLALTAGAWVAGEAPTPTGGVPLAVTGASAAPAATAAGLVLLAAALALTIAGPVVARITALGAAVTTAGALAQVLRVTLSPEAVLRDAAAAATGVPDLAGDAVALLPAWGTAVLLSVMAVTAVAAVPAIPRWRAGRSRFDRGTPIPVADSRTRAMDDWDALGRGEDPTDEPGTLDRRRNT